MVLVSLNILVMKKVNGLNASKKKDYMIGFFKKPAIFCLQKSCLKWHRLKIKNIGRVMQTLNKSKLIIILGMMKFKEKALIHMVY